MQTPLHNNPIRYDLARDARGALDEDLYCLTCGYNLRGLFGDPVRCPECGSDNDLGTVLIPAGLIRDALARMESAPTGCIAAFVAAATIVGLLLLGAGLTLAFVGPALLACACGWWFGYRRMKTGYENTPGWRGILLDFHLTTLLFLSGIPFVVIAYWLFDKPIRDFPEGLAFLAVLASVPLAMLGLRRYERARERIALMQRDRAVRLARETLRKSLRARRR